MIQKEVFLKQVRKYPYINQFFLGVAIERDLVFKQSSKFMQEMYYVCFNMQMSAQDRNRLEEIQQRMFDCT